MAAKKTSKKTVDPRALTRVGTAAATAATRRAEELIALILRRKENITDAFYDIGVALKELIHKKLYVALGYASFHELLAARALMGRTQAYKLIAIVQQLPRSRAIEAGQERAYALTALAKASSDPDTAATLLETGVKVRGKRSNVSKLSVRGIEKLTAEVRPRKKKTPEQRDADQEAVDLSRALKAYDKQATIEVAQHKGRFVAAVSIELDALVKLLLKR
jgi:hypothetical protein